ncbi:unnamed protein product [Psylliodes chrysocephalus]|uniref:Uncharacterized protein n=1 Tax=Psylliodes chrysocephalus TaxID=3402493 RepID=A0A9P0CC22_9CUCU|nr:unnamed protein product [Psylliodes chrysocephala]
MSYESERVCLEHLMEEFLSDEDSDDCVRDKNCTASSDDDSSSDSSSDIPQIRKPKLFPSNKDMPSSSKNTDGSSRIDDIFKAVILQYKIAEEESSSEEELGADQGKPLSLKKVDGQKLQNIPCNIQDSGFKNEYFEMFDKRTSQIFSTFHGR